MTNRVSLFLIKVTKIKHFNVFLGVNSGVFATSFPAYLFAHPTTTFLTLTAISGFILLVSGLVLLHPLPNEEKEE